MDMNVYRTTIEYAVRANNVLVSYHFGGVAHDDFIYSFRFVCVRRGCVVCFSFSLLISLLPKLF